jgi:hypothetical protein
MLYLAACFIGEGVAVQDALGSLSLIAPGEKDFVSPDRGFIIATRCSNQDISEYLLDAGVDANAR